MKKHLFLFALIALLLSACLPSFGGQPKATTQPQIDIQGTAAAAGATIAAQTLSPLSSPQLAIQSTETLVPSNTPVVMTQTGTSENSSSASSLANETGTASIITTAAVSGSGTPGLTEISITLTSLANTTPTATLPSGIPSATKTASITPVITETAHYQTYGTLPPSVPFGTIFLVNKAQADVYVSLQVLLADGSTTVIEYPVEKSIKTRAPAGKYFFVAWVGGREMTGSFRLGTGSDVKLTFNKKSVEISSK